MSVARRPLLTATAAGTLLCAMWFVPSAKATAEREAAVRQHTGTPAMPATPQAAAGSREPALADTGTVDTTPYLIGGTAFLGMGMGFVTYSVRRRGMPAR